MIRSIVTIFLVILILAAGLAYYLYNQPHRNVEFEEAVVSLSATQLFNEYSENEKKADSLYLNKTILIHGVITETDEDQKGERIVILKEDDDIFGVACTMDETDPESKKKVEALKVGDSIVLKGICTGFADEVKLNKCIIVVSP